jgi:hypothetical protein
MTFFFMCEYPSNFCLNLIPKPAGEPVFLVFSKHITSWYNDDRAEGEEYTQVEVAYPRWKFLPQSSINYIIQGGQILALTEEEKDIKSLALQDEPDPADPEPPVKKKSPVPAQSPQLALPPGPSKQTVTPKRKSATAPRASSAPPKKKGRSDSAATAPNVDNKREVTELKRVMRDMEDSLRAAQDRVKRLEDREDAMKNSYEEKTKKSDEKLKKSEEDYDNLQRLKRATYNHFLSRWENANENKEGDEISELKNAFPLAIRKYFVEDIEKDKNSLE